MPDDNTALVRLYFEKFPHDETLGAEALGPGFRFHHLVELVGAAAFVEFMRDVSRAFPDFHFDLHDLVAQGDLVAAHYDFGGTQADTFLGTVASQGRSFSTRGMSLFRCAEGRIEEIWVSFNALAMLEQLGAASETEHRWRIEESSPRGAMG
jgi:steroid delta-isomerase-like uncharacterized protein